MLMNTRSHPNVSYAMIWGLDCTFMLSLCSGHEAYLQGLAFPIFTKVCTHLCSSVCVHKGGANKGNTAAWVAHACYVRQDCHLQCRRPHWCDTVVQEGSDCAKEDEQAATAIVQ